MGTYLPIEINHIKEKELVRVTWADRHTGDYPGEYLRGYCPCAVCQGHGTGVKFIQAPGAKLTEISTVGNYAIQLNWNDGHNTGIYTFDYLRSLCPCPQCKET
ncbi:MAG: gamma-butyrobetaine hydroxylase-like domain-containing protein [Candidatus Binatia bacterium]